MPLLNWVLGIAFSHKADWKRAKKYIKCQSRKSSVSIPIKKHRISLVITAVITAGLIILGAVVLFNALPKPKRVKQPLEIEYGITDPRFRHTANLIFNHPIVAGNRVEILENGAEIYPAMLKAITEAKHTITFETYEFWGERAANVFAWALAKAAEREVRVHVILDYIGSTRADSNAFEKMAEAGVHIIRWRKPEWYKLSRFNHRTHRKLLIVDGRIGFTGGANIGDYWLGYPATGGYRDNHFRLSGPIVEQLQAAFMENWLHATGEVLLDESYYPQLEAVGDTPMQVITSSPREGLHQMRKLFLYAIAAAKQYIRIGTAYFYPDTQMLEALEEAANRGVKVDILLPGDNIDKGFVRHASINRWRGILEAGVRLHEYQPTMYHAKALIIDDQWVSIGSANMDNRSFRINDEANVNIFDADFAQRLAAQMEADLKQAKPYGLAQWERRPWHKRLSGWLSSLIGAHL
jgi:cardiolipin synthase A/B